MKSERLLAERQADVILPQILVVDDDPMIGRLLTRYLANEGYDVSVVSSGTEMREHLAAQKVDLVLMDLTLPGENGINLTKEIRNSYRMGIIIVTGKSDKIDRVVGLEVGADDFVSKPFDERELLARIRSVLRRTQEEAPKTVEIVNDDPTDRSGSFYFDGWHLNKLDRSLRDPQGDLCQLTTLEFELMLAFAESPNRVLSREYLLDTCAGRSWDTYDRAVDTAVVKLRRKLNDNPRSPNIIKTVRGVGYLFAPSVTRS